MNGERLSDPSPHLERQAPAKDLPVLDGRSQSLPSRARVVIVGGGIVGASVAYHLTLAGWRDVVLLEQAALSGGTTWHAAGLVGQLRTSNSLTRINKYSVELYRKLEAETGCPTGWSNVGSLIVGRSKERMAQLLRTSAMAEVFGVRAEIVDRPRIAELWPGIETADLEGGVWLPDDGKVKPELVTRALATGAAGRGARLFEHVEVTDLQFDSDGEVEALETSAGRIQCEHAVLSGGMWTRALARKLGLTVPLAPVEHHYIVSEEIEGVDDHRPVGRDPDAMIYFRSEGRRVVLGAFQEISRPWKVDPIPADFSFDLLEPDWPKFEEPLAAGLHRLPIVRDKKFPRFVNGPESFTPDNSFILGDAPGRPGLWIAAGFNSVGIASAGGAGKVLADWMIEGDPGFDLWSVDPRRFLPLHDNTSFLRERTAEVLGLHYQMAWPNREPETGRNLRRTTIHDRLAAEGAIFGQKMAWERPLVYAPSAAREAGEPIELAYSFGRQNWFDWSAAEHRAARDGVALFEQSSFSKLLVEGPDALAVLEPLCGNRLDVAPGRIVYTGLFNERGTTESDVTVLRLGHESFLVVTSTTQTLRDMDWILRHAPTGARIAVDDLTTSIGVLGIMGPRAREVLAQLSASDLSLEAFPFGTWQIIEVGPITVRALRVTYVGELGWELQVPMVELPRLYELLREAGEAFDLKLAGHYAVNSLRLEKAYRAWGHELSPDDTPLEAGLSFAIDWDKPGGFLGRDALLAQRERGLEKRMLSFVLEDPEPVLWGSEPILRNGEVAGYTSSGAYGHSLGGAVALGYVRPGGIVPRVEYLESRYEIEVLGKRVPAKPYLRAPYDPKREKILV